MIPPLRQRLPGNARDARQSQVASQHVASQTEKASASLPIKGNDVRRRPSRPLFKLFLREPFLAAQTLLRYGD
jgi:hypothetical protein